MKESNSTGTGFLPIILTQIGAPLKIVSPYKFSNIYHLTKTIYPSKESIPPMIFKEIKDSFIRNDTNTFKFDKVVKDVAIKPFADISTGIKSVSPNISSISRAKKEKVKVKKNNGKNRALVGKLDKGKRSKIKSKRNKSKIQ